MREASIERIYIGTAVPRVEYEATTHDVRTAC